MSESPEDKVLFTIASDGQVGMFPSAAAIEAKLAPSAAEGTRAFMEDGGELELQVEIELYMQPIDGINLGRPRNITTVLLPDDVVPDTEFLRRSLLTRFAALPINSAMSLADVVAAVKASRNYGFH